VLLCIAGDLSSSVAIKHAEKGLTAVEIKLGDVLIFLITIVNERPLNSG
jgi:hypothetical protein